MCKWPDTITSLDIEPEEHTLGDLSCLNLPRTLRSLTLTKFTGGVGGLAALSLPRLTSFTAINGFNQNRVRLPDSLVRLTIRVDKDLHFLRRLRYLELLGPVGTTFRFPPKLTHLILQDVYYYPDRDLRIKLPESLQFLAMCSTSYTLGIWEFPASLRTLIVGDRFNLPVEHIKLPDGLLDLEIGDDFNQPVENWTLPSKLKCLKLGASFRQSVSHWTLPDSLESIELSPEYTLRTLYWDLPRGLRTLTLPLGEIEN